MNRLQVKPVYRNDGDKRAGPRLTVWPYKIMTSVRRRESEQVRVKEQDFRQSRDLHGCFLFYRWKARRERRRRSGCWRVMHQSAWKLVVGRCGQNFPGGFWCPTPPLLWKQKSGGESVLLVRVPMKQLVERLAALQETQCWGGFVGRFDSRKPKNQDSK